MLPSFRAESRTMLFCALLILALPQGLRAAGETKSTLGAIAAENLFLVGKVWGYLKYHHTSVTQGCLDWDSELIDRLPIFLQAKSRVETLKILDVWVTNLDKIGLQADCPISTEKIAATSAPAWITDHNMLGRELSQRLLRVKTTTPSSHFQYYVDIQSGVGNPIFQNELDYKTVDDLDWRYRILALYRFWNIVEYWAPYRDLIDSDFDDVLRSFIGKLYSANDSREYELALMMLTATVQDGHTNLWSSIQARPPGGSASAPYAVRYVEGRPIVWKELDVNPDYSSINFAESDRLQVGDDILSIDDVLVENLVEKWSPYYGSSNRPALLREIAASLLRGDEGRFSLQVDRDGTLVKLNSYRIPSDEINQRQSLSHDLEGETYREIAEGIAYLKLSTISDVDVPRYVELVQNTSELIIDLRGYPKSFVVFSLGQHLVRQPTTFAIFSRPDLSKPGTFYWSEPVSLLPKEPAYDGKIVILVDEMTQSQAEYTAMAFRASPGAVVIGGQTAGADGNVSYIPLPGGHRTMISGIGVFYPDKSPTQKLGIVPDVEVLPTIAGIRAKRDEVLEAAILHIRANTDLK